MILTLRKAFTLVLFALLVSKVSFAQLPSPAPSHVVIIIEENYAYSQIIGSSYAPHINAFASNAYYSAVFTQCYAISHPSEPNYLDFFAGSNQGVTTDGVPSGYPFTSANLGAQLIGAGNTFVTYSEDLPSVGFDGASYTSSGANYVRKHNPCANWVNTGTPGTNQFGPSVNQPFTAFPTDYSMLPTVCYVVPNQYNDMHDGSYPSNITLGDNWFNTHISSLLSWALANNTLVILTFDEDDGAHGNQIATVFYGPMVKGGTYSENVNLYNLLRTIENLYGLGYAGSAASVTTITDCWRASGSGSWLGVNSAAYTNSFSVIPNPATNEIAISSSAPVGVEATICVTDALGRQAGKYTMTGTSIQVNTANYAPGFYFFRVSGDNGNIAGEGKFIIANK